MKKTTTIVTVVGAFLLAMPTGLAAQTAGGPQGRIFIGVNIGVQPQSQQFDEGGEQALYEEKAYFAGVHKVPSGQIFDGSIAYRVWQNLAVGASVSRFSNEQDVALGLTVPHPLFYGRTRTATATASGLKHTEVAVHLQATWRQTVWNKLSAAVSAGPTIFNVTQELVSAVDIAEAGAPYTSVNVSGATVVGQKKSATGFHVQADVTYGITSLIGVGAFARYAKASVDLPGATASSPAVKLDLGGLQMGGGLRITF